MSPVLGVYTVLIHLYKPSVLIRTFTIFPAVWNRTQTQKGRGHIDRRTKLFHAQGIVFDRDNSTNTIVTHLFELAGLVIYAVGWVLFHTQEVVFIFDVYTMSHFMATIVVTIRTSCWNINNL